MRNGDADSGDLAAQAGADERAAGEGLHGGNDRPASRAEMRTSWHSRSTVLTKDGHDRFSEDDLQLN
jgi:hypothetical protein